MAKGENLGVTLVTGQEEQAEARRAMRFQCQRSNVSGVMVQPCLSGRGSATHAEFSDPTLVNAHAPLLVATR